MKLDVLNQKQADDPWYAEGLRFTCTQCGNCCTGPPGFVWISDAEIVRLAEHLGFSPEQVVERFCRKIAGRFSLNETRNPQHGGYDCVFLQQEPAGDGKPPRRTCRIYPVRPLQCRTWPFWPSNLRTPQAWAQAARRCPGMNHEKFHDQRQVDSIRNRRESQNPNSPGASPQL